jgi:hypothetical protein
MSTFRFLLPVAAKNSMKSKEAGKYSCSIFVDRDDQMNIYKLLFLE